jgi:hypothetical protein
MKLALCIPVWKRLDLTKVVIERFVAQSKKFGFDIIIAGSEGKLSEEVAKGCRYIEVQNNPLSDKLNALLSEAKSLKVDGVVVMGSDDLVSDSYWKFINKLDPKENVYTGLKDLFFYSTKDRTLGHWKGYKNGTQSVGAGRFYPKKVLTSLKWELWDSGLMRGLDTNASSRLSVKKVEERIVSMQEANAYLFDIKHSISITNRAILGSCETINLETMAKRITKKVVDKINKLEIPVDPIKLEPEVELGFVQRDPSEIICFEGNGKSKQLGKKVHEVTRSIGELFIKKGYGKIIEK